MIYRQPFGLSSVLLLLIVCSGLQLSDVVMDCLPCSCQPDLRYGGTLANCSYRGLSHVSLPDPVNITTLIFDNNPLGKMTFSDFKGMTNLRHLSMRTCGLTTIDEASAVLFRQLDFLDISRNRDLGFAEAVKVASWFEMKHLTTLLFDYVVTLTMSIVPLDGFYCSFLQQSSLKELHLDGNAFSYIGKGCFSSWPKTIEVLSVRYTMIGDYNAVNYTGLLYLKSLRILDLTGFVSWTPGNGHSKPWNKPPIPPILPVMPSLQVVRYGQSFHHMDVGKCSLIPITNNLTTIDISWNLLLSFTGPFTGLENVEYIDVSHNMIYSVSKTLFAGSNKVKFVNLSSNAIGQCFEADVSGDLLKQVQLLEVLDISNNKITFLPKIFFHGSVYLKYLNVSGNLLTNFDVDIMFMSHLKELNLRDNKLNKLPTSVLRQLNRLPKVKVIIENNPLTCTCDSLEFLEWMRENRHLQAMGNQTCMLANGTNVELKFLDHILTSLYETCESDLVLIASTVSGVFALLLFIASIAVYRHRWKLRYLYHVGKNKYLQKQIQNEGEQYRYKHDAFISYADNDRTFIIQKLLVELEDKSGLKVCIHNRDFLPGDIITENIINAIQSSRKTVIVLSPEFLKSEWCIYEFHMARQDGISRRLNNLLVVLLEEVDVKHLPKDLALMLTKNSYLEYSADVYGEVVFWKTLTDGIKTLKPLA